MLKSAPSRSPTCSSSAARSRQYSGWSANSDSNRRSVARAPSGSPADSSASARYRTSGSFNCRWRAARLDQRDDRLMVEQRLRQLDRLFAGVGRPVRRQPAPGRQRDARFTRPRRHLREAPPQRFVVGPPFDQRRSVRSAAWLSPAARSRSSCFDRIVVSPGTSADQTRVPGLRARDVVLGQRQPRCPVPAGRDRTASVGSPARRSAGRPRPCRRPAAPRWPAPYPRRLRRAWPRRRWRRRRRPRSPAGGRRPGTTSRRASSIACRRAGCWFASRS